MFEAYKVGITIALTNNVSRALSLIGRDLIATDAKALKLKTTLKEMQALGAAGALIGGAGFLGLRALDKSYQVAKTYEQALNQFKSLNLGDAVNRDADRFARGANIIGASATDLIGTVRDLHTVLGSYGMARQLAPGFAQLKYANQAIYGGHGLDFNESQLRSLEKIIEMKGGFKSPQDFLRQASMMQQVIGGTGGMVKPSDYLAFIKTAGVAGRLLTDSSFYYGMEPLIQEMGGTRVGTALMSAYNNLGQGRSTVRAAKEMLGLGLVNPSMVEYDKIGQLKRIMPGALKGMDAFSSNPYQWMQDVLLPAMAAKGITSQSGILNEMGVIFGNRTASSLFSLMFLQQDKIAKNMAISQHAMNVDQLVALAKSSPQGADAALAKAFENLHIAVGESLIPIIVPGILKLSDAIRSLGAWITKNPIAFDFIVKGFAGLMAALTFSGAVLTLKAAFLGLHTVMPFLSGSITTTVIPSIMRMVGALGLLGGAATAFYLIANHQKVANAIDSAYPQVGDALNNVFGGWSWGNPGSLPGNNLRSSINNKPSGNGGAMTGTVNLDGKKVGSFLADHIGSAVSGQPSSGSLFDGRQSPIWPGAAY